MEMNDTPEVQNAVAPPGQQVASTTLISPLGLQVHDAHHDDLLAWTHSSPDASAERHRLRNAKPQGSD